MKRIPILVLLLIAAACNHDSESMPNKPPAQTVAAPIAVNEPSSVSAPAPVPPPMPAEAGRAYARADAAKVVPVQGGVNGYVSGGVVGGIISAPEVKSPEQYTAIKEHDYIDTS